MSLVKWGFTIELQLLVNSYEKTYYKSLYLDKCYISGVITYDIEELPAMFRIM